MTFLVVFGAVSVAPHSGGHVLVYVRVRWRRPRQHNHNQVLVSRSRRADDVPVITRERRCECLYVTIGLLCFCIRPNLVLVLVFHLL